MNTSIKKLALFLTMLTLTFSLTACFGGDDAIEEEAEKPAVEAEAALEVSAKSGNNLSDEEFIATIEELVELLAKAETMKEGEESAATMAALLELSAKLQGFDDARAKAILEANPELKAAIEALNTVGQ